MTQSETLAAPSALDEVPSNSNQGPMNVRRVMLLALPIVGENLLQTAVGAVDTLIVSRIGDDAIAGVGVGVELVFFILAIFASISIGATVLVAQSIGAGERGQANIVARQAISWGIVISIPLAILGFFFADRLIGLFDAEPEVAKLAIEYFEVIGATVVVLLLSYLCGAVLRGAGDSRTPLKAAVLANIFNVFFCYALVFGEFGLPELGVAGAAWGASIGRGVATLYLLAALWKGRTEISIRARSGWLPDWIIGSRIFRLGIPAGIEQVLIEGGFLALVIIVATIGTKALAAQQIAFTAMSIGFLPALAFAIAATALVGQSVGARNVEDARKAVSITLKIAVSGMAICAVPIFLLAKPLMDIFSNDPEVIEIGTRGLRAIAVSLPAWGAWMVSAGALRGSGDTRSPMLRGVAVVWLSVLIGWLAVSRFDQGVAFVWGIFGLTLPLAFIGNLRAFRRRSHQLEREEPEAFVPPPAAGYHP